MKLWKDETDFTTVHELHKDVPGGPSKYHKPELEAVENEVLEHYKTFGHFANSAGIRDPSASKRLYELNDITHFDLMGSVTRGAFDAHYDKVAPYLSNAHISFKDLEIVACAKDVAYVTGTQRYWGTAKDGKPFDLTYRTTSLVRKTGKGWQYVHEHFSFPVDMATCIADMASALVAADHIALSK